MVNPKKLEVLKKQEALVGILRDLAQNQLASELDGDIYVGRLREIYCGGFRHRYSGIYATLVELQEKGVMLDPLLENLRWIYDKVIGIEGESEEDEFFKGITKLYDHVQLDVGRIAYLRSVAETPMALAKQATTRAEAAQKAYEGLTTKVGKLQREYVTILGIFASILAVFFSGVGFSTAVLENLSAISVYRLMLAVLLLSVVLFNTLTILMNFVREMVSQNHGHVRLMVIGNIVISILLFMNYLAWKCQWFGKGSF